MNIIREANIKFYNDHKDDAALIGNKIEEHNWRVVFNRETGEFDKIPTKVSYAACKKADCQLCQEIKSLAVDLDAVAEARVVSRGVDKASMYSIARLAAAGWSPGEIADGLGTEVEILQERIEQEIESDGWTVAEVVRLFKHIFEVNNGTMYKLIPFSYEEVCKAVPRGSNGKFNFKGGN